MSQTTFSRRNPLLELAKFDQSIWLDYTRRDLIASGELRRLIEEDGVRGMTSNPSIFEKAIVGSQNYEDDIRAMILDGQSPKMIYEALSQRDVQGAADEFCSVYDEMDARDGYVSLEVNPHLAHDTKGTIVEARRLWRALRRPNVFIKVPATAEGIPVIRELISDGINVNVTLLFGLERYREVAAAYIAGSVYYDGDIRAMAFDGQSPNAIYETLSQHDVEAAADEFRGVYDKTDGGDGYVSLEVNPHLAHDTRGTIVEARRLWRALRRPNVFIKVPATSEGIPAIRELISDGINVNVTLLFGLERYREVAAAYIAGIEERAAKGKAVKQVASVASFFVSRIDSLVDPLLEKFIKGEGVGADLARTARGEVAIANA